MSWAKVQKGPKPFGWWYHKIMCEIGWFFNHDSNLYFKHMMICSDKYSINIYGQELK